MEGRVGRLEEMGCRIVALVQSAVALKEDLQAELGHEFVTDPEHKGSPPEVPDEGAQQNQLQPPLLPLPLPPLPPSPQQLQATSPSKAALGNHLSSSREQYTPMLSKNSPWTDAILKNQEALRTVLINQDTLKNLVDRLQKTLCTVEERLQVIEQEMSILSQFTQELNQVGNDAIWS